MFTFALSSTAYAFESGGDPDVIPELTYVKFMDYYDAFYHASTHTCIYWGYGCVAVFGNCLFGNICPLLMQKLWIRFLIVRIRFPYRDIWRLYIRRDVERFG
jgi:hypothetical protein